MTMRGYGSWNCLPSARSPASVGNDFADVEKWLPSSQLLITYVAGPYPDAGQTRAIEQWLQAGGRWLALHGTSGGRAERVEGSRARRTVKAEHHALLGSYFLTHPPIREFRVQVADTNSPLTRGIGSSFTVEDEPYFIELQEPGSTQILLTAEYGPGALSSAIGTLYPTDTSLLTDGKNPGHRVYEGGRQGRRHLFGARPLPHPSDPRGQGLYRPGGHDPAAVPRAVGDRGVHDPAAQRHRLGHGRLAAPNRRPQPPRAARSLFSVSRAIAAGAWSGMANTELTLISHKT